MSDTNRVALRCVEEVTFGVVPTAPFLETICFASAPNLAFVPETTVSEKIRSDRQIDDLPLVGGEASGDINSELAFRVHDKLLQGAFFNDFQERYGRDNDEFGTEITDVDGTAEEVTTTDEGDSPLVGAIVRHEGFSVSANNGFFTVASITPDTAYVTNESLEDEASPPSGARIRVVGQRGATGDITATAGATDSVDSTILDFTTLDLEPGDWIKLNGFATSANNDFVRVLSIATTTLVLDIVPSGWASDTGVGVDVDIFLGERLINGIIEKSYTIEEEFEDHSPVTFQYLRGMEVDAFVLNATPQSIVTTTFTFSGSDAFFSDATTPAEVPDQLPAVDGAGRVDSATTVALPEVTVLNSSSDVARIARGGTPITGANFVLEASVEIANNLRQLNAIGFLGSVDIGVGEFGVTGTLNTYFDDASLARDVIANTETSFDMRFEDPTAHVILIDAPRIKFSEGSPEVPGKNQDVTINLSYQAIREPTFNYTLKWMRFNGIE